MKNKEQKQKWHSWNSAKDSNLQTDEVPVGAPEWRQVRASDFYRAEMKLVRIDNKNYTPVQLEKLAKRVLYDDEYVKKQGFTVTRKITVPLYNKNCIRETYTELRNLCRILRKLGWERKDNILQLLRESQDAVTRSGHHLKTRAASDKARQKSQWLLLDKNE